MVGLRARKEDIMEWLSSKQGGGNVGIVMGARDVGWWEEWQDGGSY